MKSTYISRLFYILLLITVCAGIPVNTISGTTLPSNSMTSKKAQTKKVKKAKEIKVKRTNGNERETTLKDMYLFGVARNYRDSITYMTNIAPIHKIVCDKATGFIDGLNLYTDQLESFLLKEGHSGYICATYYVKSMKKAEKLYIKLRKKINKAKFTHVEPLGNFMYQFVSPENIYRNIINTDDNDENNPEDTTENN